MREIYIGKIEGKLGELALYPKGVTELLDCVKRTIKDFKRLNSIHRNDGSMSEEAAIEVNKVLERLVNVFDAENE